MANRVKVLLVGGSFGAVLLVLLMLVFGGGVAKGFFSGNFLNSREREPQVAMIETEEVRVEENQPTATEIQPTEVQEEVVVEVEPTATPEPTEVPEPTATAPAEVNVQGPFGPNPEDFPEGVNMLTGEFSSDPGTLGFQPALVSITNWPITARPQAGIGSASIIYELYIGQGMSRFLGLFYGEFPGDSGDGLTLDNDSADSIGPIRSGRLPYEGIRRLHNGFLVMASAFAGVSQNLDNFTNVYSSDDGDINSAMIPVGELKEIASQNSGSLVPGALSGNLFDPATPDGGMPADTFWFIYNTQNQIAWRYDETSGSYYRYADQADGRTFVRLQDRIDGAPVDVSNVVLLYANHRYCTDKAFDIDLLSINSMPATVFRDGMKFDVNWTTKNGDFEQETGALRPIRFIDANGDPFALKAGTTWIILVPSFTPQWEAPLFEEVPTDLDVWMPEEPDKLLYRLLNGKEPGTGVWVSRFYQSLMTYDQNVCSQIQ